MTAVAADWSRAYRARKRAGKINLAADVDEAKAVEILIKARLLTSLQADDRAEIECAWQQYIDEMFKD